MQILIELKATTYGMTNLTEKGKRNLEYAALYELLTKLEKQGYRINTLYGNFIFDEEKKEAIDIGEQGERATLSLSLVDSIFQSGGKMALIFVKEKYIVFADSFFLAIHFCHMRKVMPLSLYDVLKHFDSLIIDMNKKILDELYLSRFEYKYGKDAGPVSYILGNNALKTKGYSSPSPMHKK